MLQTHPPCLARHRYCCGCHRPVRRRGPCCLRQGIDSRLHGVRLLKLRVERFWALKVQDSCGLASRLGFLVALAPWESVVWGVIRVEGFRKGWLWARSRKLLGTCSRLKVFWICKSTQMVYNMVACIVSRYYDPCQGSNCFRNSRS